MKIKLTRRFYILFVPNIWTCYFREFNYLISGRVRNRVWIVGDSIVRRAKERATAQNRLHLGAEKGAVQWHGQWGATLHDLPPNGHKLVELQRTTCTGDRSPGNKRLGSERCMLLQNRNQYSNSNSTSNNARNPHSLVWYPSKIVLLR